MYDVGSCVYCHSAPYSYNLASVSGLSRYSHLIRIPQTQKNASGVDQKKLLFWGFLIGGAGALVVYPYNAWMVRRDLDCWSVGCLDSF
jgi:hypothetical protein